MKINFAAPILDLDGEAVTDNGKPDGKTVTLQTMALGALMAQFPDETLDGPAKVKRYELALRIHKANGEACDLKSEEIAELKRLIAKAFGPLPVGRSYELLERGSDGP